MSFRGIALLLVLLLAAFTSGTAGQEPAAPPHPDAQAQSAAVELDGKPLFRVRGVSSFPAEERARAIASRIRDLARDRTFDPETLQVVESEAMTQIMARDQRVMAIVDADAQIEGISRQVLALVIVQRMRPAIIQYREDRESDQVRRGAIRSLVAVLVFVAALFFLLWTTRWILRRLEALYKERIQGVGIQSFRILKAEHIWSGMRRVVTVLRALAILALFYVVLHFALSEFASTRPFAAKLLAYVTDPLQTMGLSFLRSVPNLVFLAVLFVVLRWVLRLLRLFFGAISTGTVTFSGFDREWTDATYKIVRLLVVIFAIVVAFPYIPGSHSEAFKGVSLFIGIMFSLGSSSAISNLIAGYSLIYRRAFRLGDRVKIGDFMGEVVETRLQVTHLRTIKNEEVIIPNSAILNGHVVNYTARTRKEGLILHTTVGIGYETPWRQVEAMLKMAAERTQGLLKDPPPFVLLRNLGDFAVTYELNAFTDDPSRMITLYDALHRSVLDVFNEYGVQIMTPAYEGDPEQPKVVPKENWHTAPAPREP